MGEPGSGKTITLLEIARDLIAVAEEDAHCVQPIPVVLNLASWTNKSKSLMNWLVQELVTKYQVPGRYARAWLEDHRLLPLLDGLDEVRPQERATCVQAINAYGLDYGLPGLVVCSRLTEYTSMPVRLRLNAAICLQELTKSQVNEYLIEAGSKLKNVRAALQNDSTLMQLAQSPLILSVMSLAYQDLSAAEMIRLSSMTASQRKTHLFDLYIDQMLKRRTRPIWSFDPAKTIKWLSWLACQMTKHNQVIFLMEGLQPDWHENRFLRWIYFLVTRFFDTLIFGLVSGPLAALPFGLTFGAVAGTFAEYVLGRNLGLGLGEMVVLGPVASSFTGATAVIIISPIVALIGGTLLGFVDILRLESGVLLSLHNGNVIIYRAVVVSLLMAAFGLAYGLFYAFFIWNGANEGIIGFLLMESFWILTIGPSIGLLGALTLGSHGASSSPSDDIHTVEALHWSWRQTPKGGALGLAIGAVFGLLVALVGGVFSLLTGPAAALSVAPLVPFSFHFSYPLFIPFVVYGSLTVILLIIIIAAPIGIVYTGLTARTVPKKTYPNQGIRFSIRKLFSRLLSLALQAV